VTPTEDCHSVAAEPFVSDSEEEVVVWVEMAILPPVETKRSTPRKEEVLRLVKEASPEVVDYVPETEALRLVS